LALVLHFHQPVGNFDHVFDTVTRNCYAPLLEMLAEFPELRAHLHLNGILLEWFDSHRPDLIELIAQLVRGESVEVLTGGYHEPILTVIPEEDAVGQIRALSDEVESRFGVRPEGAWLTERVFEPRLPAVLSRAGVRWVTLDDVIFRWAGVEGDDLLGPRITDDGGRPLVLFPAAKSLRYTIPFRPHEETFGLLRSLPERDGIPPLAVYADDAEKFGEWPGTKEWVYDKGWLKEFFEQLRDAHDVRTVHLSERLRRHPPTDRVYPPATSYPELTIWALPTRARARLESTMHELEHDDPQELRGQLRGGHWRGFLAKYPEVHRLHKRMLHVSRRLSALDLDDGRTESIRRDLYRGQCNDAYWHGAFGGVYLPHLRRAVERHLVRAARGLARLEHASSDFSETRLGDFHVDGTEQMLLATAHAESWVDPRGGALLSWDLREACENWVTVMQRHEEPFHADLREGRVQYVDESGIPLEKDEAGEGVATIHGRVRVKPGVVESDLQIDRHTRVAGTLWAGPTGTPLGDPLAIESVAHSLEGRWEVDTPEDRAAVKMRTVQAGVRIRQQIELGAEDPSVHCTLEAEPTEGDRTLYSEWNLFVGWTGEDLECDRGSGFTASPAGAHEFEGLPLGFRG
jgi:alpha-amylase